MDPPNQLFLVLAIFLLIFSLSYMTTSAIIPKVNVSPQMPSVQLVENLCNGKAIKNRRFCQKALPTPKQMPTLNVYNEIIKKLGSPQALKALNCCVEAYKYAILSFEMVSSELVEDSQTENYDVVVIGPKIANCKKELINAKVQAPRLLVGNRFIKYHVSMGYEITSTLELENRNEY
ncbi:hypothetical protein ES332_D05G269100v1 [Gossypium tomentosum]|uniref:Pectinesterase inhibitor domain-containing protein n=1 Tax=Gossypium tomentosum TaxID=34277 RepID=A0A5D2KZW8_GOSTO|nr:hypothetical protein ES332_D05G269100v1 [Gossypium tomentosum]